MDLSIGFGVQSGWEVFKIEERQNLVSLSDEIGIRMSIVWELLFARCLFVALQTFEASHWTLMPKISGSNQASLAIMFPSKHSNYQWVNIVEPSVKKLNQWTTTD